MSVFPWFRFLVFAYFLMLFGCNDLVIQRMPSKPSAQDPDPIAGREAEKIFSSRAWSRLSKVYVRISMLGPEENYGRREDILDNAMAELKQVMAGMENEQVLHPLVSKNLMDVMEEIAISRLNPDKDIEYLSSRQEQKRNGLARLLSAAGNRDRALAQWHAMCGLLDLVDVLRSAQAGPWCGKQDFSASLLIRFPLDVRVSALVLLELEALADL
ncbi:MAG: hypothetical protein GXP49_03765 [Deltaproteobacteria bacterium]|nr:hypothetical protein [Deltaproteobacteria bacterium]